MQFRFNFFIFFLFFSLLISKEILSTNFPVIDKIVAIVYGTEGYEIITLSQTQRPSLTGMVRSLNDLIFERMVYLDALKYKIIIDDDAIDKLLENIKRQNNLTQAQLEQSIRDAGYTLAEAREQLGVIQTVNTMLSVKIRDNLVISRADVERYYNAYPESSTEEYILEYVCIPETSDPDQERSLAKIAANGDTAHKLNWTRPFTIKSTELVESKAYISKLKKGEISKPAKINNGYEMYRLIDKKEARILTLDERYHTIVDILRGPKTRELQEEYKKNLEKEYIVIQM